MKVLLAVLLALAVNFSVCEEDEIFESDPSAPYKAVVEVGLMFESSHSFSVTFLYRDSTSPATAIG